MKYFIIIIILVCFAEYAEKQGDEFPLYTGMESAGKSAGKTAMMMFESLNTIK
jgi:hypothetical protein